MEEPTMDEILDAMTEGEWSKRKARKAAEEEADRKWWQGAD